MHSKRALIIAGLAAAVLGGALLFWLWPRPEPLLNLDLSGAEADVREAIDQARAAVAKRPRSAAEWGRLGQVLLAHGYDNEAMAVLERAGRLDPAEPRWPYLRARRLLTIDRARGRE